MPAEAEHVHPPDQPSQPRASAEAQDAVGHPDELLGHTTVTPAVGLCVAGGDLLGLLLHEYLATYAALLRTQVPITIPGAGDDAGVQLLTEPQLDGLAIAGIARQ